MTATRCIVEGNGGNGVVVRGDVCVDHKNDGSERYRRGKQVSAELMECVIRNNKSGGMSVTQGTATLRGGTIQNNGHYFELSKFIGLSMHQEGEASLEGITMSDNAQDGAAAMEGGKIKVLPADEVDEVDEVDELDEVPAADAAFSRNYGLSNWSVHWGSTESTVVITKMAATSAASRRS